MLENIYKNVINAFALKCVNKKFYKPNKNLNIDFDEVKTSIPVLLFSDYYSPRQKLVRDNDLSFEKSTVKFSGAAPKPYNSGEIYFGEGLNRGF